MSTAARARIGALALLAAVLACGPGKGAPPESAARARADWPAGTVLAVDGVPITAEDVDRASVWIERIERPSTGPQLRRLALTNVVLPRVLAGLLAPEQRERALASASEAVRRLRAGTWTDARLPEGATRERMTGSFQDLGIVAWGAGMDLAQEGAWSDPVEDAGRFLVLRRLSRRDGPVPMTTVVELDALAFPYLPTDSAPALVEDAKDHHRLTIVDPAWRAIVPERIQYRMGVHSS